MTVLLVAAVSYLLGSIPFGYLLVRIFRGEDVRSTGSGNIGATNVSRSSPVLGVLTLLLDAGKGLVAVVFAQRLALYVGQLPHNLNGLGVHSALKWVWPFERYTNAIGTFAFLGSLAALFAIIGHLLPIWLKFRGGKGVATSLGSFAVIAPKSVLCVIAIFAVVFLIFRFVSLSSVVAVASFPLAASLMREYGGQFSVLGLMAFASLLVVWRHQANLGRIFNGTEPKFRSRA